MRVIVVQVQVTAAVANFLINEARRNMHEPANLLQEQDLLIYNFSPEYTGRVSAAGACTLLLLHCLIVSRYISAPESVQLTVYCNIAAPAVPF